MTEHHPRCVDHTTCDGMIQSRDECISKQAKEIDDLTREIRARGEILDAVQTACGEGWWYGAADWRQKLRDFACDREQHDIDRDAWHENRGHGITLYAKDGFFVAYFDDAAEMWQHSDDDRPMFHVMVQSDPPHRTVIHPLHLVAWVEHFAEICMPLQIMGWEMLE